MFHLTSKKRARNNFLRHNLAWQRTVQKLDTVFKRVMWGLAPKWFFEDEGTRLAFIPNHHFGKVQVEGDFIDSEGLSNEQEIKFDLNYWSFCLGIEEFTWSNSATYGIYLLYISFDAGKALNQLDVKEQQFFKDRRNTKTVVSLLEYPILLKEISSLFNGYLYQLLFGSPFCIEY